MANRLGDRNSAIAGRNYGAGARRVGGSKTSPQIVRVLNTIEGQQQITPFLLNQIEQEVLAGDPGALDWKFFAIAFSFLFRRRIAAVRLTDDTP